jgi:hypothetical protein
MKWRAKMSKVIGPFSDSVAPVRPGLYKVHIKNGLKGWAKWCKNLGWLKFSFLKEFAAKATEPSHVLTQKSFKWYGCAVVFVILPGRIKPYRNGMYRIFLSSKTGEHQKTGWARWQDGWWYLFSTNFKVAQFTEIVSSTLYHPTVVFQWSGHTTEQEG